jgi:hypothetical protein
MKEQRILGSIVVALAIAAGVAAIAIDSSVDISPRPAT